MPEGLDLEEILDDVEVPTADFLVKHENCPTCQGEDTSHYYRRRHVEINGEYYEFLTDDQLKGLYSDDDFTEKYELVRREDHREALMEAVQQAREQERRRILERIEFLGYFEFEDRSKDFNRGYRKALEELEEEVKVDGAELWEKTSEKIREKTDVDKTAEEVAEELEEEVSEK